MSFGVAYWLGGTDSDAHHPLLYNVSVPDSGSRCMTQSNSPIPHWSAVFKPSTNFLLGLAAMGLPAGYIAFRHVDWKKKPDSRKRVWISQVVFWPVAVLGLRVMHIAVMRYKQASFGKMTAGVLAASGIIAGGFEGGIRLGQKLVPKKPPYSPVTASPAPAPSLVQQAYQQGFWTGYHQARSGPLPTYPVYPAYSYPSGYRASLFR